MFKKSQKKRQLKPTMGYFNLLLDHLKKALVFFKERSGSWALAIVIMTILLKGLTFPFQYLATVNSKKMQGIHPELKRIKEDYKDDPVKLQKATLGVFKSNGVNPFMSVIPALIQIPIFIAFYDVLSRSQDLFGTSFWLWIPNLSLPDPLFILPVLTGLFFFLSQKITSAKVEDKVQKRVMNFIPLLAVAFGIAMPAGVSLYMAVSSIFQCVGQFCIEKI